MREALAIVAEEGLPAMWARHEAAHKALWAGLAQLGLQPYVEDPADRLVTVNTIKAGRGRARSARAAAGAGSALGGGAVMARRGAHPPMRLHSLPAQVPEGIDWAAVCKNAMDKFNVEIAGGLGPTAGQVRRAACPLLRMHAPPLPAEAAWPAGVCVPPPPPLVAAAAACRRRRRPASPTATALPPTLPSPSLHLPLTSRSGAWASWVTTPSPPTSSWCWPPSRTGCSSRAGPRRSERLRWPS